MTWIICWMEKGTDTTEDVLNLSEGRLEYLFNMEWTLQDY